eukprot:SAG11_NODE_7163_length_1184_cov_6.210138_1_plen_178_part_01
MATALSARKAAFLEGFGAKIIEYFLESQNVGHSRKHKKVPHDQFVATLRQSVEQLPDFELREQLGADIDSVCSTLWKRYKAALKAPNPPAASAAIVADADGAAVCLLSKADVAATLSRAQSDGGSLDGYKRLLALPILTDKAHAQPLLASLEEAAALGGGPTPRLLAELAALVPLAGV